VDEIIAQIQRILDQINSELDLDLIIEVRQNPQELQVIAVKRNSGEGQGFVISKDPYPQQDLVNAIQILTPQKVREMVAEGVFDSLKNLELLELTTSRGKTLAIGHVEYKSWSELMVEAKMMVHMPDEVFIGMLRRGGYDDEFIQRKLKQKHDLANLL
jgi:hypothetical protein